MIRSLAWFIFLFAISALADHKGFCPPKPPKPEKISEKARPNFSPEPNAEFAGTVWLQITVTDKGYVCFVQLLRGFDKVADERAVSSARQWHLTPSRYKGHPVPVLVQVDVNFWRKPNGELIQVPERWNEPAPSSLRPNK